MQIVRTHQRNTNSTLFQSPNSRNVFTVTQANKKHNSPEPEGKVGSKWLHGQFPRSLDKERINKEEYY
jgi:hypothetical protein